MATLEELCRSAKEQGMDRLALTDTNGLYGLITFLEAAKDKGLHPIVGSEIVTDEHRAVLLVRNHEGYANLCRIISDRHCHQDFDLIASLKERRQGLIVISDDFTLLKALRKPARKTSSWRCRRATTWPPAMPSPARAASRLLPPTGSISSQRTSFPFTGFFGPWP